MKTINTIALTGIFAAAGIAGAQAHATFTQSSATEESYVVAALQVPHGCDGKATTEVQIKLPEGFILAKPQPKPGWELEVISGDYAKTYDDHGDKVTSGPVEIRWKNGDLPDAYYDTFVVRGKISGVAAGTALAFPTVQLCGTDGRVAWDEVAAAGVNPHSLESPAPVIEVASKAKEGHGEHAGHGDHAATAPAHEEAVKVGDIEVTGAFTKAMLPGQPVGGGYFTVKNNGGEDDVLVSASSSIAGTVELHEMEMQGQVMKMRKLETGIPVPAGKTVELTPGGLHLMFIKVKEPFKQGASVPLTLTFEKAGSVDLVLPVEAAGPGGHQHN
ncbi:copper chaperone PCu(A)C [Rhizobium sp. LCM 4573]|uniref:copper chaperone PCu(A)C n=1 Tax=Rhizobium sp. LCM 4573 TaxID=1848291 RepID=UPI0008DB1D79|nr:DUF1775 domain-containing protein [Rhizobium sp. LCM 4573]OHV81514.1 hypothetical protein LCM4573_20695 [Rhizobium sp. LCM 4573]